MGIVLNFQEYPLGKYQEKRDIFLVLKNDNSLLKAGQQMASMPLALLLYKCIYKNLAREISTELFGNFPQIVILATKEGSHRRLST